MSFMIVSNCVLADFNRALSGLNFAALRLANFTVIIDPEVLKHTIAVNDILLFFSMLNTLSSNAFK